MHTFLCGHARGTPLDYVEAAAERGIALITFTCHTPIAGKGFHQTGIRMHESELKIYREMVAEARTHGEKLGVEVLYGIEAEVFADASLLAGMHQLIATEPFDFVLGSLHHQLPVFREWLAASGFQSDPEIIAAYFDTLALGAETGLYDSLSHPDVIRIYGTLKGRFDPIAHEDVIKRALDRIAASGTCMEINTSGLIKGDYIVHPDPIIMGWALERGIQFTLGSDSHTPDMVGQHFEEVIEGFHAAGLRQIQYFRGRKRRTIKF